jgi:SAM-dependent methyltransferase
MELPFRTGSVDVCYSSNVLEHVPDPWRMADEMVRVTRPGGTVFISYTLWFGPWGGHETAPWHYLGGRRARRRYAAKHGHEPKNKYGESLFAVTAGAGLRWARAQQEVGVAEVVDLTPRYNPRWSRFLLRVPLVREVVTWNLVIVLRKR